MRLISIHIENFGKLSNVDLSFKEGTNLILEANGWGKSTLAAFIKAMLYGLEGDGKRDDFQCERKRFAPWQGGSFGGKLLFEADGKAYEATRFFGSKANEDTFELRDVYTNLISNDYSERLGEELFSINSESFMKTVFVSQLDIANSSSTDDINAKLGNISDGLDLNKFAFVDETFKDLMNQMSATRKTGEIARLKAKASELKASINRGIGLEDTMAEVEGRINDTKASINELKDELANCNEAIKEAAKYEKVASAKSTYDNLAADLAKKEADLKNRAEYFPKEIPSLDIAKEWDKALLLLREKETAGKSTSLSDSEARLYDNLVATFKGEVPSGEEFDELTGKANRFNALRNKSLQNSLSKEDEDKLYIYENILKNPEEAVNRISKANGDLSERFTLLEKEEYMERYLKEKEYYISSNSKKGADAGLIIGLIILVSGLASLAGTYLKLCNFFIVGLVCVLIGFTLTMIMIGVKSKRRLDRNISISELDKLKKDITECKSRILEIEESVKKLFTDYNITFDIRDAAGRLQSVLSDAYEFKNLKARKETSGNGEDSIELDALRKELKSFLLKYGISCDEASYEAGIIELKGKANHYASLMQKADLNKEAFGAFNDIKEKLITSLAFYGIDPGMDIVKKVDEVLDVLSEYDGIKKLYNDAYARVEEFKAGHNMDDIMNLPKDKKDSLDSLHKKEAQLLDQIEAYRNNLTTDNRSLDEYSRVLEEINDERTELLNIDEEIKEKTQKLEYITRASEFFVKAKENLTAKYMGPLLNGVKKYYGILTGENGDNFHIDANTVITIEEKGRQRDKKFFSQGYQDMIGLCERLSMADAMYPDEKPVLIFDDPFVNLDDKKTERAKVLLDEVGKEYQIIYLTCRENRI